MRKLDSQAAWTRMWQVFIEEGIFTTEEVYAQPFPGSPLSRVEVVKHAIERWGNAKVDERIAALQIKLFGPTKED